MASQRTTTVRPPETDTTQTGDSLISIADVQQRSNHSRTAVWRYSTDPKLAHLKFPKPIRIGRRTLFSAREIDQWIADRLAQRDGGRHV